MATIKTAFIAALGIVGFYGTWGRCALDGTLGRILKAVFVDDPFILPGTDAALLKNITGIWPFDRLLAILIIFFWQATDGSHPTTTAIGLYFAFQHMGVVAAMYLDSWRLGKASNRRLSPTLWTLIFQCVAIGPAGPIYAALYLAAAKAFHPSTTTPTSSIPQLLLPLSLLGGYILPTILMGLPSPHLVSPTFKQYAIAAWNVFPIWIFLLQTLLPWLLGPALHLRRRRSPTPTSAARIAYATVALAAAAAHVGAATVSACSVLFPALFSPELGGAVHPARLFVPPTEGAAVGTIGEGVRSFMLWDQVAGYGTMLFLACVTLREVAEEKGTKASVGLLVGTALGCTLVVGPGCTVLVLQWVRDEIERGMLGKDLVKDE